MKKLFLLIGILTATFFAKEAPMCGAGDVPEDLIALQELQKLLLSKYANSCVNVEYYFKYDEQGERTEIPNAATYLREQRPARTFGYVLSEDEIITPDANLRPEWLEKINLELNGKHYRGEIVAYYPEHRAVKIKTATPIENAQPLRFNKEAANKRFYFARGEERGIPSATVMPYTQSKIVRQLASNRDYWELAPAALIVDENGEVLALAMNKYLPLDTDLFAPPTTWTEVPASTYEQQFAAHAAAVKAGIYAAQLRLTPSKFQPQRNNYYAPNATSPLNEFNVIALKIAPNRVLIPAELSPAETARLRQIILHVDGQEIPAEFVGSLRYFAGLVAETKTVLPGGKVEFCSAEITRESQSEVRALLVTAQGFGKKLKLKIQPTYLDNFGDGFRGYVAPRLRRSGENTPLLFTATGKLLGVFLERRQFESGRTYGEDTLVPAALLTELLNDFDMANVPLDSEKIAWLGVEYQRLTPELARLREVAEYTQDGRGGLWLSHIYPNSPATALGLQVDDILVNITAEALLNPYNFAHHNYEMLPNFPWERYDMIPVEQFENAPQPWGTTRNALNTLLTHIGIGNSARLTIVRDGKLTAQEFTVAAAPESFDTSKKTNIKELGISVSDLTYEVANYFQLKPDEKAVLIAKVVPGGLAAVAGIKPYEMIVSVNDTPVSNVEELQKLITGQTELRLGVRRLSITRLVNLRVKSNS